MDQPTYQCVTCKTPIVRGGKRGSPPSFCTDCKKTRKREYNKKLEEVRAAKRQAAKAANLCTICKTAMPDRPPQTRHCSARCKRVANRNRARKHRDQVTREREAKTTPRISTQCKTPDCTHPGNKGRGFCQPCYKRWWAANRNIPRLRSNKRHTITVTVDPQGKTCNKCKRSLTQDSFHRAAQFKSGYHSSCKECIAAWRKLHNRDYNPRHRICEACGKQYQTKRRTSRVCSLECRWFIDPNAIRMIPIPWMHEPASILPWASCLSCHRWIWMRSNQSRCDNEICNEYQTRRMQKLIQGRERHRQNYIPTPKITLTCQECSIQFETINKPNIKYCPPCGRRIYRRKYRQTPTGRAQRKRDRKRNKRRREAKKASQPLSPNDRYDDPEIFERDNWICQLCKYPIDREATVGRDDWSVTIDHIIPFDLDGPDAKWNVQCAHLLCNSIKRNRPMNRVTPHIRWSPP